jgi:hypothetical protein
MRLESNQELGDDLQVIMDCFTGVDGAVSFCKLKQLLEECHEPELEFFKETLQPLVKLIKHCGG